ncbi:MAG: hypothetical protein ACJ744_01055 [Gaiellaceae bacterium]
MSEPEPEIDVPLDVRIGVWANDIRMLGDVEDVTLDFVRVAPHDRDAILVARVTLPPSCILKLKSELEGF